MAVAAFNQEKALVGAFSMIIQPVVEPMDSFTALEVTAAQSPATRTGMEQFHGIQPYAARLGPAAAVLSW